MIAMMHNDLKESMIQNDPIRLQYDLVINNEKNDLNVQEAMT